MAAMLNDDISTFVWCIYCERGYHRDEVRKIKGITYCAYSDCEAHPEDTWCWDKLRENCETYPKYPQPNTYYSMFNSASQVTAYDASH